VDLPFRCSYCEGYFCIDHKLPENHQCPELPQEPLFWYQKKKQGEERAVHIEDNVGTCPKCNSKASNMIDYDAKTMTFECKKCGHKWTQLKSLPHSIIESKDMVESKAEPEQELKKPQRKLKPYILAFCVILIIVGAMVAYGSHYFGYNIGSNDAYNKGYEIGQSQGYVDGNLSGYNLGHSEGYDEGFLAGKESGYNMGYEIGYVQGVTDGAGRGYNIRDPTYQEALQFISSDQTDKNEYSENYTCDHFTADFKNNAFKAGFRCGYVSIHFPESAHAIVCFNTTDQSLIFIEPQYDDIVTLTTGQSYAVLNEYEVPDYDDTIVNFMIVW
jgi:hypothetical protein